MSGELEILSQNRDMLLLAEAAAWLHDMGKCSDEHISQQAEGASESKFAYKSAFSRLLPQPPPEIALLGDQVSLKTLVEKSRPRVIDRAEKPWLLRVLARCHSAAHVEKEKADDDQSGKQPRDHTRPGSPLGAEGDPVAGLTDRLRKLPFDRLSDHSVFERELRAAFSAALGDTRRPINEVTLWDWSATVAALFKAALANALLGTRPEPDALHWRLLGVRVDGSAFVQRVARIPDLIARRHLLAEAFGRVRELLEKTYPLGTEVYRDENGSVYVVPDNAHLLACSDADGHTLEYLIGERFADHSGAGQPGGKIAGEVKPTLTLGEPWCGSRPADNTKQGQAVDQVPPITEMVDMPPGTYADPATVTRFWAGATADVCPVCGQRPQGPGAKARDRGVCDICEARRVDRSKKWSADLQTTIWLDEVADLNGRLALVVGQFALDDWLDPDRSMVETLAVTEPANGQAVVKNPSFARLRRVWETTGDFWGNALKGHKGTLLLPLRPPRLAIFPENAEQLNLGPYHAYELLVHNVPVAVVWDHQNRRFITCDNLEYLAAPHHLGLPLADALETGQQYELAEPSGSGRPARRTSIVVSQVVPIANSQYEPVILILSDPRTFMALVPGSEALGVATAIKTRYEREMGKVRNRLPLTLGVVYFGRRSPLSAALDAGRRMLTHRSKPAAARVEEVQRLAPDASEWPGSVKLTLATDQRRVNLSVCTVMGDGTTRDVWYPYWLVQGKPTDRTLWFEDKEHEYWVHVSELRQGDTVTWQPSSFDLEYLDTSARRFEVSYDPPHGQRRGAERCQRPYLLEELERIEEVWQEIRRLSLSQIRGLESLIEAKRRLWKPRGSKQVSDVFRCFVKDSLHEVGAYSEQMLHAAASGMLSDALELHITLGNEKSEL